MNAYELADKLEWHWDNDCRSPAVSKSADMLRQQADRIAELEKQSEPIEHDFMAWETCGILSEKPYSHGAKPVKLYRHPPQTKPLSDEEIEEVIRKHWNKEYGNRNMLTLCKAVLAKANK